MNLEKTSERIDQAIQELSASCRKVDNYNWRFIVHNDKPLAINARLERDWLVLDYAAARYSMKAPANYLLANGLLPGLGKAVVLRRDQKVRLRAEIPLDSDVRLPWHIGETCAGFAVFPSLLSWIRRGRTGQQPTVKSNHPVKASEGNAEEAKADESPQSNESATQLGAESSAQQSPDAATEPSEAVAAQVGQDTTPAEFPELLKETAWPYNERSGGEVSVALDAPEASIRAIVRKQDEQTSRLTADLGRFGSLVPAARNAIGLLLVSTAGSVRMARPVIEIENGTPENGAIRVFYEVLLHASPSLCEIDHALKALTAAARTCAKEVIALTDERIATTYLSLRGWNY